MPKADDQEPQGDCQRGRQAFWYAYPRWIEGEAAVVYHFSETGKGQLYVYRLEDGSTRRVSTNAVRLPLSAWRSGSVLSALRRSLT